MRVIINEALLNRNKRISHILFFVSLAGMGLGFFYTWTSNPSSSGSQLSCFILPLLLLMTISSVRMANQWVREPRPVIVLDEALKGFGKKYTIFHHILPAPHVLIGPEGVFCLTTVWQERAYRVSGKRWYGDDGLLRKINGWMRQDLIGNPFTDATFSAQQLQRLLDKSFPGSGVEVQPLIVFINPRASVQIEDPLFPVLYADPKKKPSLRQYLRDIKNTSRATLTQDQLDQLDARFGLMTREELAEMLGETLDDVGSGLDEDTSDESADDIGLSEETIGEPTGSVYIAQAGQLFYIGSTTETLETAIESLRTESDQPIELVHDFPASNPEGTAQSLRSKFERKRQKENWYGLSKKDVAWIKSRREA